MANIRVNRDVISISDVQNVIVSTILRQSDAFTTEDIIQGVEEKLKFSIFGKHGSQRKEINVKQKVEETLNVLFLSDNLKYDYDLQKYKLSIPFPRISI